MLENGNRKGKRKGKGRKRNWAVWSIMVGDQQADSNNAALIHTYTHTYVRFIDCAKLRIVVALCGYSCCCCFCYDNRERYYSATVRVTHIHTCKALVSRNSTLTTSCSNSISITHIQTMHTHIQTYLCTFHFALTF